MEIMYYKVITRDSGTKSLMVRNKKVKEWTEALVGHPSEHGDFDDFQGNKERLIAGYRNQGYQVLEVPNY